MQNTCLLWTFRSHNLFGLICILGILYFKKMSLQESLFCISLSVFYVYRRFLWLELINVSGSTKRGSLPKARLWRIRDLWIPQERYLEPVFSFWNSISILISSQTYQNSYIIGLARYKRFLVLNCVANNIVNSARKHYIHLSRCIPLY